MKAIKDAMWEVKIHNDREQYFWFYTTTPDDVGVSGGKVVFSGGMSAEQENTKAEWEAFAKLNGIKNWKYVK